MSTPKSTKIPPPPTTPSSSSQYHHQQQSTTSSLLPHSLSQIYSHLHPILLLSLCYVGFRPLVADPVSTLLSWTPLVAGLQLSYCVLCLPASTTPSQAIYQGGAKKKRITSSSSTKPSSENLAGSIVPAILALLLTLTLSTPIYTIVLILFGAPLTTHHAQTALLATHLSLLSFPGLFYLYGLNPEIWRNLASFKIYSLPTIAMSSSSTGNVGSESGSGMEVYAQALGTALGAWLGAIPIPLDWDRDWQVWPVTVVVGGFVGAAAGKILGRMGVVRWLGSAGAGAGAGAGEKMKK